VALLVAVNGDTKGASLFPYWRLRDEVPDEIWNAEKPLAVACASGIRSTLAASFLKRAGVKNVQHVADGGVFPTSKIKDSRW
jgi:hydroxyacylglutathione hydrolase